jgi:FtsP/CotA-like multicopper oxidase with cupredoxin domain
MRTHDQIYCRNACCLETRTMTRVMCMALGLMLGLFLPSASLANGAVDLVEPKVLEDINADPDIVEVNLEAGVSEWEYIPGVKTTVWAYNGTVPGPSIEAEVGQTLIVNFTNSLPVFTTVHWHGVELPAHMDGSNIAQALIPPGGSFRYEFKILNAATHWYHPHVQTNEQIEMGLYGPMILRDPLEDVRVRIPRSRQYTLMVDDILLADDGEVADFATDLSAPIDPADRAEEIFNARNGNVLLVNGRELPTVNVRSGVPLRLRVISPANGRFMRISLPGHSIYQIGSDGGLLDEIREIPPVQMISDDMGGLVSDPDPAQGLLVTPAERADVVLTPVGEVGEDLYLEWHDFPMGRHQTFYKPDGSIGFGHAEDDGKRPPIRLLRFHIKSGGNLTAAAWNPVLPLREAPIPIVGLVGDEEPLPIFFGHGPPMPNGNVVFFNAVRDEDGLMAALAAKQAQAENPANVGPIPGMVGPPPFQPLPFAAVTEEDALEALVGETRVWHLVNFTGGDHTFHPHGFFFQPLEQITVNLDGTTAAERVITTALPLEEKDSIRIPRRPGGAGRSWTIVRMAVQFDDSAKPAGLQRTAAELEAFGKVPVTIDPLDPTEGLSGGWVSHCHFLEHADAGMMTFYNLRIPE